MITTTTVVAVLVGVVLAAATYLVGYGRGLQKATAIAQEHIELARADAAQARSAQAAANLAATMAEKREAAGLQLEAELRQDLKDSERKRLEVGACIGQVIAERKTYEDLYFSLVTGCTRAQHWLFLEIERLSRLANKPIDPRIAGVMADTNGLFEAAKKPPVASTLATMQAKIDAVTAPPPKA